MTKYGHGLQINVVWVSESSGEATPTPDLRDHGTDVSCLLRENECVVGLGQLREGLNILLSNGQRCSTSPILYTHR